jgi:hypothetical protein
MSGSDMTPERAALGLGNMLAKNMTLEGELPRRAVQVVLDEYARIRLELEAAQTSAAHSLGEVESLKEQRREWTETRKRMIRERAEAKRQLDDSRRDHLARDVEDVPVADRSDAAIRSAKSRGWGYLVAPEPCERCGDTCPSQLEHIDHRGFVPWSTCSGCMDEGEV